MFASSDSDESGNLVQKVDLKSIVDAEGYYVPRISEKVGPYTVLSVLGKGSYACVVKARKDEKDEPIALKIIRSLGITQTAGQ